MKLMNVTVRIEVEVKISPEEYEKLEAEGSLQDHLEKKARGRIEHGKGEASFYDGKKKILEDVTAMPAHLRKHAHLFGESA